MAPRRLDRALAGLAEQTARPALAEQVSALLVALAGWHRVEAAARAAKLRTLALLSSVLTGATADAAPAGSAGSAPGAGRVAELVSADLAAAAEDLVAAEAAALLSLSRRQVLQLMSEAWLLSQRLPRTLDLLGAGVIERSHVSAMLKVTDGLSDEAAAAIENELLGGLAEQLAVDCAEPVPAHTVPAGAGQPPTPAQIHRVGAALALALGASGDGTATDQQVRAERTRVVLTPGDGCDPSPASAACRAGLATIQATMPAPDAALVWATVDAAARLLRLDHRARRRAARVAGRPESEVPVLPSLAQLRAQALVDLVCSRPGEADRPAVGRVELQVTMPVTMFGALAAGGPDAVSGAGTAGDSSAAGHASTGGGPGVAGGPASAAAVSGSGTTRGDLARLTPPSGPPLLLSGRAWTMLRSLLLSSDVRVRRLFTWPNGSLALAESITHDPPESLDRHVRLRDGTCRAPGCLTPACGSDLDHVVPYQEGDITRVGNLHALCRHHHRLKTFTSWRPVLDAGTGQVTWTSPSGRRYVTRPENYGWLDGGQDGPGRTGPGPGVSRRLDRGRAPSQPDLEHRPGEEESPPF